MKNTVWIIFAVTFCLGATRTVNILNDISLGSPEEDAIDEANDEQQEHAEEEDQDENFGLDIDQETEDTDLEEESDQQEGTSAWTGEGEHQDSEDFSKRNKLATHPTKAALTSHSALRKGAARVKLNLVEGSNVASKSSSNLEERRMLSAAPVQTHASDAGKSAS